MLYILGDLFSDIFQLIVDTLEDVEYFSLTGIEIPREISIIRERERVEREKEEEDIKIDEGIVSTLKIDDGSKSIINEKEKEKEEFEVGEMTESTEIMTIKEKEKEKEKGEEEEEEEMKIMESINKLINDDFYLIGSDDDYYCNEEEWDIIT